MKEIISWIRFLWVDKYVLRTDTNRHIGKLDGIFITSFGKKVSCKMSLSKTRGFSVLP